MGLTYVHLNEIQDSCSNLIGLEGHCLDTSLQGGTRQGAKRGVISDACYKGALYQTDAFVSFRGCSFIYLIVTNHHRTRNECKICCTVRHRASLSFVSHGQF